MNSKRKYINNVIIIGEKKYKIKKKKKNIFIIYYMNVKNISNNYADKNYLFVSDVYKYCLKKFLLLKFLYFLFILLILRIYSIIFLLIFIYL